MSCSFCGGPTRSYDGGEANDYQLCVEVCQWCGEWQDEETDPEPPEQPSMGTCSRCGSTLNNVAPGFSVVAGGQTVCTTCLVPGEEIARARSIT